MKFETLMDYATDKLSKGDAARVEAHLSRTPEDAAKVARIRALLATLRSDDSVAPPGEAVVRARAIFKPDRLPERVGWLDRLERTVAALVFDSRQQPALAGLRGAADQIQLSYESEVGEIDIELQTVPGADPARWAVVGQISLNEPSSDVQIALVSQPDEMICVQVDPDEHGVFSLQADEGTYDLLIRASDRVIVLPHVELQ